MIDRDGYVYFMQPDAGGPIKIGYSEMPKHRLRGYQQWSPVPLKLIAAVKANPAAEPYIHGLFASARLHHEWFRPTDDLLSFIDEFQRSGDVGRRFIDLSEYLAAKPRHKRCLLRQKLRAHNLSVDHFCADLGIDLQLLNGWHGQGIPHSRVNDVVDFFGKNGIDLSPVELIGGERGSRGYTPPRKLRSEAA